MSTATLANVPKYGSGSGRRSSIVWVNTDTRLSVGSEIAKIAGPTTSMVTAVVPMIISRLRNALALFCLGVP